MPRPVVVFLDVHAPEVRAVIMAECPPSLELRLATSPDPADRLVLARDELHEEALRALMVAHAAQGDRTPALRAYQRFAERLKRELEAEPSRETRAIFERLQAGQSLGSGSR